MLRKVFKISIAGSVFALNAASAAACSLCRAQVESGIYDRDFAFNLFIILLPIVLLAVVGIGIYASEDVYEKFRRNNR